MVRSSVVTSSLIALASLRVISGWMAPDFTANSNVSMGNLPSSYCTDDGKHGTASCLASFLSRAMPPSNLLRCSSLKRQIGFDHCLKLAVLQRLLCRYQSVAKF